ncbi:hypothetical protein PV326_008033 [Microctonus aethiopoides]|nr:hypothetical protein PV326_008033 [Microctonus aethiopoides]
MNVMRPDNSFAPPRTRKTGNGRGRGRLGKLNANQQVLNLVPKYQIPECRRPLVNLAPSTSSTTVTPKGPTRRGYGTTSSSCRRSSTAGRNTTDSGTGKNTTPGSLTDGQETFVVMAITSGRGDARGEVGLAVMDVQYPYIILCQLSDCHSYVNTLTKIHAFNPVEILMPETMCIDSNNLYTTIKNRFNNITITGIPRIHFIDVIGLDRIRTHCAKEFSSVELIVHQKYYALAACAALMKYIEFIQHIQYLPKTMRIEYQVSQNTTMIDIESAQSLELVTTNGGQSNYSLLGALDRCSTPMGRRLLRASILQPPCDIEIIKRRQMCIEELISNRSLHSIIQPVVRRLSGANRLLSLAMNTIHVDNVLSAERNLNYILLLKNIVEIVPELRATLNAASAEFFRTVFNNLNDQRFEIMKEKIFNIIHPDARSVMGHTSANMQRCFAIKSGINDMLDIARQTYCELIDDMQLIVEQLGQKYNFPLSLGCNVTLGYHIQMDVQRNHNIKIADIPKEFIQPRKLKNSILMTTEPLVVLSQHCRDACDELHVLSNALLQGVLNDIREHIGCLFKLNDNIAELDLIMSLAQISSISEYIKPTFGSKLEIRNSKHPVMDILANECPIPNDVVASIPYNFQTITGPNMSGKTIYLKQIVLLHIMAQIGCYVPATKAEFRITDHIFCRLGVRDDIEYNASTFTLEIKEVQYILQSITKNSLVVLDELCRSTTVEEGSSIAWTICKKIAMTSAFTFNATHFLYLLHMADLYPNITNYYMEAVPNISNDQPDSTRLIYTHQLKSGVSLIKQYGITLARATNFPADILKITEEMMNKITKDLKPAGDNQMDSNIQVIAQNKKNYEIILELNEKLENGENNRDEICELARKIVIFDYNDKSPNTSRPKTPRIITNKNATQSLNTGNAPKTVEKLSIQKEKLIKRTSKIISTSSASPNKIRKFSSLLHNEQQFKIPREPLRNLAPSSQSNLSHKSPNNNSTIISQKLQNILKNPTTNPESPLFVPSTNTFIKPLSNYNAANFQPKDNSKKNDSPNLKSPMKNIIIKEKKKSLSPLIIDTRHLLLPVPSKMSNYPEVKKGCNNLHISFDNKIPKEYNYMRHILKNIDDNNPPKIKPSDQNKQNEFFLISCPATRQSNSILPNDYHNSSIDNTQQSINNDKQIHTVSPMSRDLNTNDSSTDYDFNKIPSIVSNEYTTNASAPSYITLSSSELLMSSLNSQTSIETAVAQKLAREKEAKIFRIIEGSDFDENEFFKSTNNVVILDISSSYSQNNDEES